MGLFSRLRGKPDTAANTPDPASNGEVDRPATPPSSADDSLPGADGGPGGTDAAPGDASSTSKAGAAEGAEPSAHGGAAQTATADDHDHDQATSVPHDGDAGVRIPEGDEVLPSSRMPESRRRPAGSDDDYSVESGLSGGGMSQEEYDKAMDYEAKIDVQELDKSFGSFHVLDHVSFRIPKDKITVILGPSGTGKSVFFSHVIGLLKPDSGRLLVDGENIPDLSERELQRVRKKFGILFQDGALFGSLNIFDNVAFPLRQHTNMSERDIGERVNYRLTEVGLGGAGRKFPNELSGGMRKRAGYARALVMEPEIVMYDEPTSGLDPVRAAFIDEMILETSRKQGGTHVVISHDIGACMRIADYVGLLFKAKMVVFGPKEWIKVNDDVRLRQFLEGKTDGPLGMD